MKVHKNPKKTKKSLSNENKEQKEAQNKLEYKQQFKKQLTKYFQDIKQMFARQKHITPTHATPRKQERKYNKHSFQKLEDKQVSHFRRYADLSLQELTHHQIKETISKSRVKDRWKQKEGNKDRDKQKDFVMEEVNPQLQEIFWMKEKSKSMNFRRIHIGNKPQQQPKQIKLHLQRNPKNSSIPQIQTNLTQTEQTPLKTKSKMLNIKKYEINRKQVQLTALKKKKSLKRYFNSTKDPLSTSSVVFKHLKQQYSPMPEISKIQRMRTQVHQPKCNAMNNRIFVFGESVNNTRKKWNKNKYFLYKRDLCKNLEDSVEGNDALHEIRKILEEQAYSRKSRGTLGPWKFQSNQELSQI